jgi:hypothetical protein
LGEVYREVGAWCIVLCRRRMGWMDGLLESTCLYCGAEAIGY